MLILKIDEACNYIKKETLTHVFSCEVFKNTIFFKNTVVYRASTVVASEWCVEMMFKIRWIWREAATIGVL